MWAAAAGRGEIGEGFFLVLGLEVLVSVYGCVVVCACVCVCVCVGVCWALLFFF